MQIKGQSNKLLMENKMKKAFNYFSWLHIAIVDLFVTTLAIFIVPVVVPFAKNGHLPKCFRWLETYDNPITGEPSHWKRWEWVRNLLGDRFGLYFQTVGWLWRNKAYNYSYYVSGREIFPEYKCHGNALVGNNKNARGYNLVLADNAWCLFAMVPFFKIGNFQIYWRIYLGWKIKSRSLSKNKSGRAMLAIFVGFRVEKLANK